MSEDTTVITDEPVSIQFAIGMKAAVRALGGAEGVVTAVTADSRTVTVNLGHSGVWSGPAGMVTITVPPDIRHPAVIEARKTDPVRLTPFTSADDVAARHVAATLQWVLDNIDFYEPAVWLGEQAALVEASVKA